ncbi:MAG: STM4015 family protein [Pirellulales bacterium]|nr:STM4015 family protein [Pirellulales bacterium]
MSFREFEYADGKSFKFWMIDLQGTDIVTRYGRIGTNGQESKKSFASEEKARKEFDKLVKEKTRKGYVEKDDTGATETSSRSGKGAKKATETAATSSEGALSSLLFATTRDGQFESLNNFIGERVADFREGKKPPKNKTVFRVRVSYEEMDDMGGDEPDFNKRMKAFLESDAALQTRGLIIGAYDVEGGVTSKDAFVAQITKHKDRLPELKALFLGDITQEESEISWITHTDVSPVLAAFHNLEMLRIRGSSGLQFSKPMHDKLRALAIESGGLGAEVVKQVLRGHFPELEYLELWLGTPDYEGDCRVNDLQPLFKGKLFPKLKYLGLRNAQIADDIAAVIAIAPIMDQLETLDLSLGTIGDLGANALLQLGSNRTLRRLDLHYNFISKPVQKQLKKLPFPVDVSDAQIEEDEEFGRFVSVSE